jgi:hypothetical protein
VYQLGEQPVQSVAPLKVFDEKAVQSSRQNTIDYPIAEVVYQFVQGKDLVENIRSLPTCMRNLNAWYTKGLFVWAVCGWLWRESCCGGKAAVERKLLFRVLVFGDLTGCLAVC